MKNIKGTSLAIETVIYMILAVLVLAVLIAFLLENNPKPVDNERLRLEACAPFAKLSSARCDAATFNDIKSTRPEAFSKLSICQKIDEHKSRCSSIDLACVLDCCKIFCPST